MDVTLSPLPAHRFSSNSTPRTRRTRFRRQAIPQLSVVIVNYLHWEDTGRLVQQLRGSSAMRRGQAEIVIVDNHSPAHPIMRRLRRMREVSLRRWGGNHGFARAVNEGCRLSQGDWLLLLNPDVSVPPDFVEKAIRLADEISQHSPRAGIIGFGLRNEDGSVQPATGPYPTFLGSLWRLMLPRKIRKYHVYQLTSRKEVPWVTGCCLLIRKDCFQSLKGLDEDFFLYYEDVDLCRRARQQGWSVWHEPSLQVVHHQPIHRRSISALLRLITRHALLTYAFKNWPRWQALGFCRLVQVEGWLRQRVACWQKKTPRAQLFGHLYALAGDLARSRGQHSS